MKKFKNRLRNNVDYVNNVSIKEQVKLEKIKMRKKDRKEKNKLWFKTIRGMYNLPMVDVDFGKGVKQSALLDSGSSVNVLSKKMYDDLVVKKLVINVSDDKINCVTATNESLEILGVCRIKVKIQEKTWVVSFFIAEKLSWDIILGMSFMEKTGLILNLRENQGYFAFDTGNVFNLKVSVNTVSLSTKEGVQELRVGCEELKDQVVKLVEDNPNVFTNDIGKAIDFQCEIKLKDTTPVKIRPYPVSPPNMKIMREITDSLLKKGIIEPSLSSYSSPSFLVSKGEGKGYRLVTNYKELNSKIEPIVHPIGELQGSFNYLSGASIYTVLDLNNSYYQVPLAPESRHLTAFSTPYSLYQYTRCPYGLHLGSGLLSSYLDRVFSDMKFISVISFVDDVLVFSKNPEEHIQHLTEVVRRLSDANLTVNPAKALFAAREITFLGHRVSHNSLKIDSDRTKAIKEYKSPTNAKNLSRFIGMINFYSRFIENFAILCAPLNELRKKNAKFKWTDECETNFRKLKECVCNPPVLRLPNYEVPFILQTDASQVGCASVLLQEIEGVRFPIHYYSKKFTKQELNLSVYEKEALGVVLSIQKFRSYLEVMPFYLETDNQALSWVLSHHNKLGKLGRWTELILGLPFKVKHIKGKENKIADCLSRMFEGYTTIEVEQDVSNDKIREMSQFVNNLSEIMQPEKVNILTDYPLAYTDIREHQKHDSEIVELTSKIKRGEKVSHLLIQQGVLMFKPPNKSKGRIVVPAELRKMILHYYHNSVSTGCHLGMSKTMNKIRRYFYWDRLYEDVRNYVKECEVCNRSKQAQRIYHGEIVDYQCDKPMSKLYVDVAGSFPRSKNGNNMLLVIVDDFTKYVWLVPLRDARASSIVKAIETQVFKHVGTPEMLVTDNASYFRGNEFKNFCFKYGIKLHRIVAYNAKSNKSERYIKTVKQSMVALHHDCHDRWDSNLHYIQLALNTAVNDVTKHTAFQLMYNFEPNCSLSAMWGVKDLVGDPSDKKGVKSKFNSAIKNLRLAHAKTKQRRLLHDGAKHPFKLFDMVYVKLHHISNKAAKFQAKLAYKWSERFRIIHFLTPVTVLLQKVSDVKVIQRAHIDQLKKA